MRSDCHVHMVLDAVDWKGAIRRHEKGADEGLVRGVLARYRDMGYTYLRDGGDKWGVSRFARSAAESYGIRYRTPLAPICKLGHYGGFIGERFDSMGEYAALVARRREQGADFIKIMISGLMDFDRFGVLTEPGLDAGEIREMIHIAHEEGFAVMAHANGADTVKAAARAGVDSVEHGAYLDNDALHAMTEAGTVWVPTLSTIGNLRDGRDGSFDSLRSLRMTEGRTMTEGAAGRHRRYCQAAVEAILESALENVAAFAQMGGLIAPGTDAGAWAVPHGCSTEAALLEQAGVTAEQLEMGTARVIEKF